MSEDQAKSFILFVANIPINKTQSLAPFVGFAIGTGVSNQWLVEQNQSTLNQLLLGVRYTIQ